MIKQLHGDGVVAKAGDRLRKLRAQARAGPAEPERVVLAVASARNR